MKNLLKKFTILSIIVIVFGCSKDDVSSSTPCVPITCLNGGTSKPDCGCDCPIGYTGNNCGTQVTPTKITISKVVISNFPAFRTVPTTWGTTWDYNPLNSIDNNPDLYLVFINSTSTYFNTVSNKIVNAVAGTQYTYNFTTPVQITNVNAIHNITLYNWNSSGNDDEMGTKTFTPSAIINNFPSIITVTDSNTNFQVKFYVTYTW